MARKRKRADAMPAAPLAAGTVPLAARHQLSGGQLVHNSGQPYTTPTAERLALSVDTVYACVRILADAVAGGSVGEWRGTLELPPSRIVRRPMATLTRRTWLWQLTSTLALYNLAVWERLPPLDAEGVPSSLVLVSPARISWGTAAGSPAPMTWHGPPTILPATTPARGPTMLVDNEPIDPDRYRVLWRARFPTLTGVSAYGLTLARSVIEAAAAAATYTESYWSEGGAPTTVLHTDHDLNGPDAQDIADAWVARRALGPSVPAVLTAGVKASAFGADMGTEAASAAAADLDAAIARYFGVPVHLVAAERSGGSSLTYSNVETEGLHLARYTVSAYSDTIADGWTEELPGGDAGRQVRIGLAHLTTPEMAGRFAAWESAIRAGWLTVDEVREREGYGPLELTPAATAPVAAEVEA